MTFLTLAAQRAALIACATVLACSACKRDDRAAAPADSAETSAFRDDAPAPAVQDDGGPQPAAFDIRTLSVSEAPLGEFPYLGLPDGYRAGKTTARKFERVPFWTGDRLEWVEGRVHGAGISAAEGAEYSHLELVRNIEALVTGLGGHHIASAKMPREATDAIQQTSIAVELVDGLGDIYNDPMDTFVIRRADRDIWIHLARSGNNGSWMIAETRPVEITAQVLPADALRQSLERDGKVAIEVNFATDQAVLLPTSKPQIEQVVALLRQDPALRLAVNGHTDNTGSADHNLRLSQARARTVVDTLIAAGIAGERLESAGFGDSQPVADNASEEGKAKNRRVELVKV